MSHIVNCLGRKISLLAASPLCSGILLLLSLDESTLGGSDLAQGRFSHILNVSGTVLGFFFLEEDYLWLVVVK